MRYYRILFLLVLILCILSIPAISAETLSPLGEEIALPADFDFSQSKSCSGHYYFHQFTVREDGSFLVCSHHIDVDSPTHDTFSKQYIDLYDTTGTLLFEYSFYTSQEYIAELTDTSIRIYFYDYCISIDLSSNKLQCHEIPPTYVSNNKEYDYLRQSVVSTGEWRYSCTRSLTGYTKLSRSNGSVTQLLVNMPGYGIGHEIGIAFAFLVSVASIGIIYFVRKKKNN